MGRQAIYLLVLSIVAVLLVKQVSLVLHYLGTGYHLLDRQLAAVFSGGYIASIIRYTITLVLLPTLVAAIPATLYWFFKRKLMPYFFECLWLVWVVVLTRLAV